MFCFFYSVSVQGPAFYSPLLHLGQCSMKCSSVSSLHPTHISLFLCQEFSPRFKLFMLPFSALFSGDIRVISSHVTILCLVFRRYKGVVSGEAAERALCAFQAGQFRVLLAPSCEGQSRQQYPRSGLRCGHRLSCESTITLFNNQNLR